jgi:hypothetical protein
LELKAQKAFNDSLAPFSMAGICIAMLRLNHELPGSLYALQNTAKTCLKQALQQRLWAMPCGLA